MFAGGIQVAIYAAAARAAALNALAPGGRARVVPEWGAPARVGIQSFFFFFDLCLDPDSGWIPTRVRVNPR